MKAAAGYVVMSGNLFDSAVMKTSVIDEEFRQRFLSNPDRPNVFEGRAIVFEGPEDYHARIEDPALQIEEQSVLIIRNCGPGRLSRQRRSGEHAATRKPACCAASTRCPLWGTAASPAPPARPRS